MTATPLAQTIALNWSGNGRAAITGSIPITGDGLIVHSVDLVNGTKTITAAIRAAGLSGIYMKSTIDCTVTFRDGGGTSVGVVSLLAGVPYAYAPGLNTIPISADCVTISAVAVTTGVLDICGLQDSTPATATAALTGTLVSSHLESGIVSGSYTAILTLTGASWQPTGAAFNAQRQAIIDGFVSAQSEAAGWNAQRPNIPVTAVARTSASVVTVTLPALGSYSITSNETITVTIPAPATTADAPIVASPTVTVTANS